MYYKVHRPHLGFPRKPYNATSTQTYLYSFYAQGDFMHKVEISIHWWNKTGNTLGNQHLIYRNFFQWKLHALLVEKLMLKFCLMVLKKQEYVVKGISQYLSTEREIEIWGNITMKVPDDVYTPSVLSSTTRVKSGNRLDAVWAPRLSFH